MPCPEGDQLRRELGTEKSGHLLTRGERNWALQERDRLREALERLTTDYLTVRDCLYMSAGQLKLWAENQNPELNSRIQYRDAERVLQETPSSDAVRNGLSGEPNSAPEAREVLPSLEWQVTYDVVAYNASWGGYGDNASKEGFQSVEQAIAYAKPLGAHLNAQVWQRTTPKPVPTISVKVWPPEKASDEPG